MSTNVVEIDAAVWEQEVLRAERPVVVDFYSTECPPCEALAPKFEALAELYGNDLKFVKIFRQGNKEIAERLHVTSSPTVLFYVNGDRIGGQFNGAVKRADVQAQLDVLVGPERAKELHNKTLPYDTTCDVLIIGAGPAGLTAGIYTSQAKLDTIVVDRGMAGGNLNITHSVSNFPGFPKPQAGFMLAHYMSEHAKEAGVKFRQAVDITASDLAEKWIRIDDIETIHAKKVIVATGTSPRPIGVEGEMTYRGKGISYCATCDAKYYEGKHVVVIGGGNSAIEESLFIAKFASKITIVHQFDTLQANKQAQEAAFAEPKISFLFKHEPREFTSSNGLTVDGVDVEDLQTKERKHIVCDGAFIFAGMQPNLDLFDARFALDEWGYVKVDEDVRTSIKDVFAAGDVRSKRYRQMTTAVSDGTIAAMALVRELGA